MSLQHLTPKAEKRVKVITDHLENLDCFAKFLFTLAGLQAKSNDDLSADCISLSLDTLEAFAIAMDCAVDSISAELGLYRYKGRPSADAYILKPQATESFKQSQDCG